MWVFVAFTARIFALPVTRDGDKISATKQQLLYVGRPITEDTLDEHGVRTESTLDVDTFDQFAQASKV